MAEKEYGKEVISPKPIKLGKRPENIDLDKIKIEKNQCFLNSYRTAKHYPGTKIIEGLILIIDENNGTKPAAHVWNELNGEFFDVTKDFIWESTEEHAETKEIRYLLIKEFELEEFAQCSKHEFSFDTTENVAAVQQILDNT